MSDNLEEGQEQPVTPPAPPPQAAIPVADLSNALVGAYQQIMGQQPRQTQAPLNPFDSMTDAQRQKLMDDAVLDPIGVGRRIAEMSSQVTEQRLMQQALPLIQSQANNLVELYKMRKQRTDPYFAQVEPLFDASMVGCDVTPLVRMNQATVNHELDMRWNNARVSVLEKELRRVKPEPTLLSSNSTPAPPTRKAMDDLWLANMAKQYGFTEAQLKELEDSGE